MAEFNRGTATGTGFTGGNAGNKGGTEDKGGATSLVEKVKDTAASAWHKAEELAGDVRDTAAGAWHKTEDLASSAAGKVKDAGQAVAQGAECAYTATRDKAGEVVDNLTGMIRRNPMPALCAGLGLGFLIGALLGRRHA